MKAQLLLFLFAAASLVGCKAKEEPCYYYEPGGLRGAYGVDTGIVNTEMIVRLELTMAYCCGAKPEIVETSIDNKSRSLAGRGKYECGSGAPLTTTESHDVFYKFTPTERGYYFIKFDGQYGPGNTDSFFIK